MKNYLKKTAGVIFAGLSFSVAATADVHPTNDIIDTTVEWESLGDMSDSAGFHYIQRITVKGNTDMKGLAFNQFARKMNMMDSADTLTEIVPGYYLITSPRLSQGADSVVFEIDTRGYLVNCSYMPDGFHRVMADNTAAPVVLNRKPMTNPDINHAFDIAAYPKAEEIFAFNESLATDYLPGIYDIIPSFASVSVLDNGEKILSREISLVVDPTYSTADRPARAEITVKDNKITVKAATERAAKSAARVFEAKVLRPNPDVALPAATLTYDPDFEWRGMMIDIARNFQTPETLKDILNLMADNGLNKLHFHPVDDEAWRIELPSLPELISVGSHRGWGTDENDHLFQIFTGDGNPDNLNGTSNGYYSRAEFIDLLKMAHDLSIDVVTEIESPGHARAAIKAMERRAKDGDSSYRLIHDNDSSVYTSAQSFHDNIMNPALESTYKFMERVIDDIVDIYAEAGVPLTGIHIGGDEVPRGAWNGSSVAAKFMKDNNIDSERELHAYFVKRVAKMLSDRGVPMYGWQEIALDHGPEYDAEIAPLVGGVNSWSTLIKPGQTPIPVKSVMGGYPTILSNVDHFYFDLSYSAHPDEPGLSWGGHTNEFTAFDGYADILCPITDETAKGKIYGINAHVFAETMRSPDQLLMYLTPKIFGLAERAAHRDTTYTVAEFNTIIGNKELPALEKRYRNNGRGVVHINQPGIKISQGLVYMNAPYEGGEIRYTTDGSEPDAESQLYTGPFPAANLTDIRAKYFRNGAMSVTTYSKK